MGTDLFADLEALYAELPQVLCEGCGTCCVSPNCTLVEFLYLIFRSREILSADEFSQAILAHSSIHPDYEGNLRCAFLNRQSCAIHNGRAGACRLFGIDALNTMGIGNMVSCSRHITTAGMPVDASFVSTWLARLVGLNRQIYAVDTEPFFLTGLSFECWLDIYFDQSIRHEFFKAIRATMHGYIDIEEFADRYRPKTNLSDKLDKIVAFHDFIDIGDAPTLRDIMLSIRNDYPHTGTYYYPEANRYLQTIDDLSKTR